MAHIDREAPASRIAAKFGGVVALARALGKAQSTCHRWLVSGFIPSKHQAAVMAAAREKRIKLRADEFIPAPKVDAA